MNEQILGFLSPWIIYSVITLLHLILPGKWVTGYVADKQTSSLLRYRLNGRLVLFTTVAIWYVLGHFELMLFDWLYTVRWYSLAGAFVLGILYTFWSVLPHPSTGKSFATDLFLGRIENPQYVKNRIDAKMWLYLVGAIMLEINVLSFVAHHYILYGAVSSTGILLCAAMLTWFVLDYLSFENVHLYTYDIFAERVGFKLGWGCLTFYPFFYSIALWSTVALPDSGTPIWLLILSAVVFLSGWVFARAANMQKFFFKINPENSFLGIKPISITDGNKTLLVNGFWGTSRHINYLGEILMGTGIALSAAHSGVFWPWLYPLYYVALLVPRQMDDDKRCELKYGPLWAKYTAKVKYKIIPGIY